MPHIHRLYDWVVSAFIVHKDRTLLCYHKKYKEWLPVGGHVDLDEDPEEALFKEIREECGLKVKILAEKPAIAHRGVKPVYTPSYVDVHHIKGPHKHIALIYFAVAKSDRVKLLEREHKAYLWLSESQLNDPKLRLTRSIRFYCRKSLQAARQSLLIALIFFCGIPALFAQEAGYRVVEVTGSCYILEPFQSDWKPLKKGTRPQIGSVIRTDPALDSAAELVADPHFENSLRIGPGSRLAFLNILPLRVSLDEGKMFVLKEEISYVGRDPKLSPEVRILTREFLVGLWQGGFELDVTRTAVILKVFSEAVSIQPKIQGGYGSTPFSVEEGFRYSSAGWTRLTYPDYKVWQAWYKRNNEQRDELFRAAS